MTNHNQPNRLFNTKSPYLLQHAYNPVDWYPWGEEAFEKAKDEDKPIFLSIGYSTCHWCHVMERESFEDEEVAAILNKYFISIKVDREERPDIDNIYMNFCQATTGHGGWPLSVFLTPEMKPFYAGTYFPKNSRYGMHGFMDILGIINDKWKNEKEKIQDSANKIVINLGKNEISDNEEIDKNSFDIAYEYFERSFDNTYGGFGNQPKFPTPHNLMFLLRYYIKTETKEALNMVEKTLIQMYKGGIFDHIGFGFSRYSTDRKWLAPHFEKMLYDNALLIITYLEAFQITNNSLYKEIVEKVIHYIIRDMTSLKGGFFCAEDADSEGVEGKFYIWSKEEIIKELGEEDGNLYCKHYNITEKGNFEGFSIPNLINNDLDIIEGDIELKDKLKKLSEKLFNIREKRVHPHKDDKILVSWNGLMIVAFSKAGKILNNPEYIKYAENAIRFIEKYMFRDDGRLFARYRDGDVNHLAYIDDYEFLIWAYIEFYQGVFKAEYLKKAIDLTKNMIDIFEDKENGGFFLYGNDSEKLIIRPKEIYDGAIPSGNSIAAYVLLRLSKLTGNNMYEEKAERLFNSFGSKINDSPMGYTAMLIAKMYSITPIKEIVLAGKRNDKIIKEMINLSNQKYLPFTEILLNEGEGELQDINEFASTQAAINDKTTAYICENFACKEPVFDINGYDKLLINN